MYRIDNMREVIRRVVNKKIYINYYYQKYNNNNKNKYSLIKYYNEIKKQPKS